MTRPARTITANSRTLARLTRAVTGLGERAAAELAARPGRFKAALKRAGRTQEEFAALHQVTYQHLYLVLRGKRQSPRLVRAIEAFIASYPQAAA